MTHTSEPHADRAGGVSPRTDTEKVLADIWARVLNLPQVGIFDDFIELGGDSMYALQVINRIRTQFSVQVALVQFFVEPSHVAAMAAFVDEERAALSASASRCGPLLS